MPGRLGRDTFIAGGGGGPGFLTEWSLATHPPDIIDIAMTSVNNSLRLMASESLADFSIRLPIYKMFNFIKKILQYEKKYINLTKIRDYDLTKTNKH